MAWRQILFSRSMISASNAFENQISASVVPLFSRFFSKSAPYAGEEPFVLIWILSFSSLSPSFARFLAVLIERLKRGGFWILMGVVLLINE